MNTSRKLTICLISLILITASTATSIYHQMQTPNISNIHSSILVIGNSAMDAFFAGNGTDGLSWETAYVLENLEIDAGGVGSAIRIENTNRYLVIRNCTLTGAEFANGEAGAAFYDVENVLITECNIQFNHFIGIYFNGSSHNEVFQNNIGNNTHGIALENQSNFNIVTDNVIRSDYGNGILFENSSHNTAFNNIISGAWYGISTYMYSIHTNLTNNLLENNQIGIDVDVHNNHSIISYNTIQGGFDGIVMNRSNHAIIEDNLISDMKSNGIALNNVTESIINGNLIENATTGIDAFDSIDNLIFMNKFSNIWYSCAKDNGNNHWNNSNFGNYWEDYELRYPGASTDDNRIWNTPYQINTTSIYDYLPMVASGRPYVTTPGNRTNVEGGHCSLLYWIIYDTTILGSGEYVVTKDGVPWDSGEWTNQDVIELISDYLPIGVHIFTLHANDGTRFGVVEDTIQMTITPFGTPIITTQSQTINEYSLLVEWELLPDADLYYIYVNGEFYDLVGQPTTELLVEFEHEGVYTIFVTGINGVMESEPSDVITITVQMKKIPGFSLIIPISVIGIIGLIILFRKKVILRLI